MTQNGDHLVARDFTMGTMPVTDNFAPIQPMAEDLVLGQRTLRSTAADLTVRVIKDPSQIDKHWDNLANRASATIYQTRFWAETCLASLENLPSVEPFVACGFAGDELMFVLPLVLERGLVNRIRWIGGSHANICFGLFDPAVSSCWNEEHQQTLLNTIRENAPAPTLLALGNQPTDWQGHINPLLQFDKQSSVHNTYHLEMVGGFDAVLAQGNAKRKRKKFRQQCRTAEPLGGYKLNIIKQTDRAEEALADFLEQKRKRFESQGIANVFETAEASAFLDRLALSLETDEADRFLLFTLEVGQKVRAIFAGGLHQEHLSGYFSSFSEDELTSISPGEMLLYLMVEYCCANDIRSLDLGQGDERYKRSWCGEPVLLFDTILPLQKSAVPAALWERRKRAIKGWLRNSPKIWKLIQKLRKR